MKYKKCSRLSCLYHAPEQDIMGCDYCYLTGQRVYKIHQGKL